MSDGGEVPPPWDRGGTKRGEVLINDSKRSGQGPTGEVDTSELAVAFNKVCQGPHGGVMSSPMHLTKQAWMANRSWVAGESGGGGGPSAVGEVLVEGRVPLFKVGTLTEESGTSAIAIKGQVVVLDHGGEREGVDASIEGLTQFHELRAVMLVRQGASNEAQVGTDTAMELVEQCDGMPIASATERAIKASKLGRCIEVREDNVIVCRHLGMGHGEAPGECVLAWRPTHTSMLPASLSSAGFNAR